jgi:hypothetical protein
VLNPIRTEPSGAYGVENDVVLNETSGEENAVTKATPAGTTMAFGAITGPPVNGPASVVTLTCTSTGAAPAAS